MKAFFVGCSNSPSTSLKVVLQLSDFNSLGEFKCNNGILFYFNKTKVASNKTKCLATAQWEDSNVVQCWSGELFYLTLKWAWIRCSCNVCISDCKFQEQAHHLCLYENFSCQSVYIFLMVVVVTVIEQSGS